MLGNPRKCWENATQSQSKEKFPIKNVLWFDGSASKHRYRSQSTGASQNIKLQAPKLGVLGVGCQEEET